VLEAALWGFVGGLALLAGAIAGLVWDVPRRQAFDAEGRSPLTGVVTTLGFALSALLGTL
jgi:hypothetical protein